MELNDIIGDIKRELEEKDTRREKAFIKARAIRRASTKAVREIHKENYEAARALIDELKGSVKALTKEERSLPLLQEALQEYAEAELTWDFLTKTPPATPKELGIPAESYILGLADSVGEIRRYILDEIRRDSLGEIEYFLDLMDEIYHGIIAFDYPNAILPIRRKQDVARLLLEKTRGEVTLALKQAELNRKLGEVR